MALKKLTCELSWTEFNLYAQVVAVEDALGAKRARIERLEGDTAAEPEKRHQLLAQSQETSEPAS